MEIELKVTGLKEAIDQLEVLASPKVIQAIIKNSLREGLKPIKVDAARRLGKRGRIWTGTQPMRFWGASIIAKFGIGVRKEHWQEIFREYGTKERYLTGYKKYRAMAGFRGDTRGAKTWAKQFMKKGAYRGRILLRPFIRPAVDSKLRESISIVTNHLDTEVKRIIEGKQKAIATFRDYEEID